MKDYAKYQKKRQQPSNKLLIWMVSGLCLVMIIVAGYYCRRELTVANIKNLAFLKMPMAFSPVFEKKKVISGTKKVVADVSNDTKPVHFEFYDELPKVSVGLSQKPLEEVGEENAHLPAKRLAAKKQEAEIVSAQNLEQDLYSDLSAMKSAEKMSSSYILQIGIFHQWETASRYRDALQSAGLQVAVVRVKQGAELMYRLQQGPYHDMGQLKLAKKRLAERGIAYKAL